MVMVGDGSGGFGCLELCSSTHGYERRTLVTKAYVGCS